jgi:hypothetical protein
VAGFAVVARSADAGEVLGVVWVGDAEGDEAGALGFVVRDGAGSRMADGAGRVSCETDGALGGEVVVVPALAAAWSLVLLASSVVACDSTDNACVKHG